MEIAVAIETGNSRADEVRLSRVFFIFKLLKIFIHANVVGNVANRWICWLMAPKWRFVGYVDPWELPRSSVSVFLYFTTILLWIPSR